jgi:two-component system cell cycle response regulator
MEESTINKQITFDDFSKDMDFIKRLYDVVRIVDPISNHVLDYKNKNLVPLSSKCHDIWEKKEVCKDCITRNAFKQNETFAKIEYINEKVYMILAIPILLSGKKVILELLRDITKERILFDSVNTNKDNAYNLLRNRNINIIKDGLTNIYNNRYINERLPYDIINSYMKDEYLSILMVDIDNFKEINEKLGHNCGNIILMEFAELLEKSILRYNGWVARYTADTFIVVLINSPIERANQWAEDFRSFIENYRFSCKEGENTQITTSIGVYSKKKVEDTMEKLINRSKLNLGRAKEQGKNCVVTNG